jgi:hypothetical protein
MTSPTSVAAMPGKPNPKQSQRNRQNPLLKCKNGCRTLSREKYELFEPTQRNALAWCASRLLQQIPMQNVLCTWNGMPLPMVELPRGTSDCLHPKSAGRNITPDEFSPVPLSHQQTEIVCQDSATGHLRPDTIDAE